MYLETTSRTGSSGKAYGPYYQAVSRENGVRKRRYVSRSVVPLLLLLEDARRHAAEERRRRAMWVHGAVKSTRPGRQPAIPTAARKLLESAGYGCYGNRVVQNRDAWKKPEAMEVRFALLTPAWRELIGSPENLAKLTCEAWRRLRSTNRNGVGGYTYGAAFGDALRGFITREGGARATQN